MNYYLVTINISDDSNNSYKRYHYVCSTLRKALECANHKAWVNDFKPLYKDKKLNRWKWDNICKDWYKNYWEGYIKIAKKQMWEKPGD